MLPLAFGFGAPQDMVIIAVVVLLLFGGSKLSGFGKSLGEGIKEFKKATTDDEKAEQAPVATVYDKTAQVAATPEKPVTVGVATEEKPRL